MMRKLVFIFALFIGLTACESNNDQIESPMNKIVFLHHSTGLKVWKGKTNRYVYKLTGKGDVQSFINKYNRSHKTNFEIREQAFPTKEGYGWKNYPYDYYHIWVKNAGEEAYMGQPTLEMLSKEYGVIIFKHCYPVSKIQEDTGNPNIDSDERTLENYKLQYQALKEKLHAFPDTKFILWTPAVHVKANLTEGMADRTRAFYNWIMDEWNETGDNIYLWDFYALETEGSLYLQEKYASSPNDSHPNAAFAARAAKDFASFIIAVAEGSAEN
ncbi:MAG: hypothetical protein CSA96_07400 [Bacteroidetes bacterium]|nr:MAG: hypothetical protein CSA96_07400 [Bacteroidota bacterium]